VRGGLDDALDKLARRDELRRRAAGERAGTPPAVTELVEAVAAVVARNPELAITMGVEGAGDPVLLHFALEDGTVQVSADNPLTSQVVGSPAAHRQADFDLDLDPVDVSTPAADPVAAERVGHRTGAYSGDTTVEAEVAYAAEANRSGYEDRTDADGGFGYAADHATRHPYGNPADLEPPAPFEPPTRFGAPAGFGPRDDRPAYRDERAAHTYEPYPYPPHPYAAPVPPPVPPQTRTPAAKGRPAAQRQLPEPMPMPLREEPEAAEIAAKRLTALLREDPSLLHVNPQD
jgi:hypothetical protein